MTHDNITLDRWAADDSLRNCIRRTFFRPVLRKVRLIAGYLVLGLLGPLLFVLYINDFHVMSSPPFNDSSILYANNNLDKLESVINRELANVNEWHKVTLNTKKIELCNLSSSTKENALDTYNQNSQLCV